MQPYKVIKELESDNSRKFKESVIEREDRANNTKFFEGVSMAMDKLRTFGLKQVPESVKDGPGIEWGDFKEIARQLEEREITGNTARQAVHWKRKSSKEKEELLKMASKYQKDYIKN